MASERIPFRARKTRLASEKPTISTEAPKLLSKKRKQIEEVAVEAANVAVLALEFREAQSKNTVLQISAPVKSLLGPDSIAEAIKHLKFSDPKLKDVIECHDLPVFQPCTSPFASLVRSIVYQQLGINAAAAIYRRLISVCKGEDLITPDIILRIAVPDLRSIGLSTRKAGYLHDLANNFVQGHLSDDDIPLMEDDKLMSALTAVKGIGVWSVHMFMIFALHRPDVLPVSDLGVRKGFQRLHNLKALPSVVEMEQLSQSWRPFRSVGSWYMWRLIGNKAPVVVSPKEG